MRALRGTLAIVVAGVVGAVVRIAFAIDNANANPAVDSKLYRAIAHHLVSGDGYVVRDYATHQLTTTASHPPAFPFLLAAFDLVGLTTKLQQRIPLALVAAVGVVITGFVARHLAGDVAGAVAAFIAAVHPLWIQHAGAGVSESLYLVVVPLLLLVGLRATDRPTWQRMAIVGVAIGVVALTRSEGVFFIVVMVVPLAIVACRTWKERIVAIAVAALAMLAVLTPWLVRNYDEFGGLTMTTNQGVTLAGGWCDSATTTFLGGWDLYCVIPARDAVRASPPPAGKTTWDELSVDRKLTRSSLAYAREHLSEVPKIVAARLGRTFGVYRLDQELEFDYHEGRDKGTQRAGQILYLILLPFAVYGAFRVGRRYLPVLLAGPIVAAISAAIFYGSTRMRVSAEPAIVVLAAVGIVAFVQLVRRRRARDDAATAVAPVS